MEFIKTAIDFVLHLNQHLSELAQNYGGWFYAILFLIIFCETGLVVTPFLPGDSLLFAVGALSATPNGLNPWIASLVMLVAAFLGDNTNYWAGRLVGKTLVRKFPRFIQQKHLDRTHQFFERYGAKTIIIARFVPIVRTFTPFVAGMGAMTYPRFLTLSVGASLLWIGLIVPAGYLFGNLEPVKKHFELVVLGIIFISILPAIITIVREKLRKSPPGSPAE